MIEIVTPDEQDPQCNAQKAEDGESTSLAWKDITYRVPKTKGMFKRSTGETVTLLNSVSGCIPSGQCVAIMGPSGCGKSTLLDVLAGRMGKGTDLTGQVLINGIELKRKTRKCYVAYVMQDDSLNGVLTVRENLTYSALLRLPPEMSYDQKMARVDHVIDELGLRKVANTKIGNVFFRGVSGGERRRTSIGMELVTEPKILLLDEPTSGLDSMSARMIVETLVRLARNGRTVLTTIHQPSSQVFQLFDRLLLLVRGEQVFFGPVTQALDFFARNGAPCPNFVNPADHYLEAINYDFQAQKPEAVQKLIQGYAESEERQYLMSCISQQQDQSIAVEKPQKYGASWLVQLRWLTSRTFVSYLRDPGVFWARIIMYSMLAILLGLLDLRMPQTAESILDRSSVLFFSIAFLCFMSVAALPAFLEERDSFVRERRNAYYSVSPYALSHIIISIPFIIAISLIFSGISYYMMNLNPAFEAFVYYNLVLIAALLNAEGLVIAISAVSPTFIIGLAAGAGLFGMYMLLCGYFVLFQNIGWWLRWFSYIDFQRYCFEGMMYNEFYGANYTLAPGQCLFDSNGDGFASGIEVLSFYGYENTPKWGWFGIALAMAAFYYFVFYLFLRFFNKGERS